VIAERFTRRAMGFLGQTLAPSDGVKKKTPRLRSFGNAPKIELD
jgi:hypothetical protein